MAEPSPMTPLDKWFQSHRVLVVRMGYAFYATFIAAMLYVGYPVLRWNANGGQPFVLDRNRIIVAASFVGLWIVLRVASFAAGAVGYKQRLRLGYLGEIPSVAHRVNPEAVRSALAPLETPGAEWWPPLRSSVEGFLAMPAGTEKWQARAELLDTLYAMADHGPMPLEARRKVNDLRRAINLEIDAP